MATKLSAFTMNAKKWREEHGFTTPEWEQYADCMRVHMVVSTLIGVVIGVSISIFTIAGN